MLINRFLNSERQLRNGWWWILIFFLVLASILMPALLVAQQNSKDVSIGLQAVILVLASWICQRLRRKPVAELLGEFNVRWFNELSLGNLVGSALMLFRQSSCIFWAGLIGNGILRACQPCHPLCCSLQESQ